MYHKIRRDRESGIFLTKQGLRLKRFVSSIPIKLCN